MESEDLKFLQKYPVICMFLHHKFHMDLAYNLSVKRGGKIEKPLKSELFF
jgi:hypothetical protein